MLASLPRLDDDGVVCFQPHALPGLEHVIVEVSPAGEPHAAAADHDFTRLLSEPNRLAEVHRQTTERSRVQLRFHHQSPGSATRVSPRYASIFASFLKQIQ
ncbi:hypothetical protein [Piscinibacter sp. XHJ-5]|uniref:hypothetical protein n=1 Tax=Piscinibacter sp. XHJ-5 TaxID=3037797 RepID=UPI0024533A0F|nr:hypothetical protein [Piscinibacter sp. XHJ-5]